MVSVQGPEWTCPPMDSWDFGSGGDPAADEDVTLAAAAAPCDVATAAHQGAAATTAAAAAAAPAPQLQQPATCQPPQQRPQRQPNQMRPQQQQAGPAEAAGSSRVCMQAPAGWLPAHSMVVPRSAVFYCASFCALPGLPHTRVFLAYASFV